MRKFVQLSAYKILFLITLSDFVGLLIYGLIGFFLIQGWMYCSAPLLQYTTAMVGECKLIYHHNRFQIKYYILSKICHFHEFSRINVEISILKYFSEFLTKLFGKDAEIHYLKSIKMCANTG